MPHKRSHPELVQKQIEEFGRDLGAIATSAPFIDTDTGRITSVLNPTESIIWKEQYIVQNQTRCLRYDPMVSGFERGENHGWCTLANIATDPTSNPAIHSHHWRDARHKWLRNTPPRCLAGELTTCSGYFEAKYYVPHIKQFRLSNDLVHQGFIVSDRGEVSRTELPQYFMAMYSVEVKQTRDLPVPITISAPESVGIFVSGHLSMSSGRVPNVSRRHVVNLPKDQWVRLDFLYYNPVTVSGRFSFGHNLIDYIDGWRTPQPPNEAAAFYTTFTRKDPGSVGKFSYVLAHVRPTIDPQNLNGASSVDIDWRAPGREQHAWRRLNIPVDAVNPTLLVSGVFRVPHSSQIELRSRTVNQWGDFGPWHPTSGLFSSAGNVRVVAVDNVPPVKYALDVGVGSFEFDVQANAIEEWAEFILVSGHGHDPHVTNAGVYQLLAPTNPGDMFVDLNGSPPFITSGMICSIDGGYQGDRGELHTCNGTVQGSPSRVRLLEPVTSGINVNAQVKFYQIAKRSNDDHFILPKHDKAPWFFNLVGRNYNGGMSHFADPIGAWKTNNVKITATEAEIGGGRGENYLRNGSFEIPQYTTPFPFGGYDRLVDNPIDWWFTSGTKATDANPNVNRALDWASDGDQAIRFASWVFGGFPSDEFNGISTGVNHHIFGTTFGHSYSITFDLICFANGGTPGAGYATSGQFNVYHEIWSYNESERLGANWQYGSLPPSAQFITSSITRNLRAAVAFPGGANVPDYTPANRYSNTITVTKPTLTAGKKPLVRLNIHSDSGPVEFDGVLNGNNIGPDIIIDNVAFTNAVSVGGVRHPYDEPVAGGRFDWQSIRLNPGGNTTQGDHLDVDRNFGLVSVRRRGNTTPFAHRGPSPLTGFTVSGNMDFPRLIAHHPNAADTSALSAPINHQTNSKLMNAGIYVVPSGRALKFEITPRRSFLAGTETEEMIAGFWPVGWIMPSGGRQYNGHWYDPGQDAVFRVNDIRYDVVGGASQLSISRSPIYAANSDLVIKDLRLESFTAIIDPGGGIFVTHWHACDVSIYEVSLPFVASGVNTAGTNNVGHSSKPGLINFTRRSTSAFQE